MTDNNKKRPFEGVVKFKAVTQGNITIAAENEEEAKEILLETFKDKEDLEIIQVFDINEVYSEQILTMHEEQEKLMAEETEENKTIN